MHSLGIKQYASRDANRLPGLCLCIFALLAQSSPHSSKQRVIDALAHGAKGNGVIDDTAALQSAFGSLGAEGGTVHLPCGTYLVTGELKIDTSNTSIQGSGDCTILKVAGGNSFVALTVSGRGLGASARVVRDTMPNSFTVEKGELTRLGIAPGSYAVVSDKATASNGPGSPMTSDQQIVKVISVTGDTATIEDNFAHDFTLASPHPQIQGCCPYVQKILAPVSNVSVTKLRIDGKLNTGSESEALAMNFAVDSEIAFVNITNFAQPTGRVTGVRVDTGYHNRFRNITCTACGNGGGVSFWVFRQSQATIENLTIRNSAAQSEVFGLTVSQLNNSTVSNVTVDAGEAKGRPFKLARANHNVFDHVTAKNGTGGMNGISITDISTYNTFNHCAALNNMQTGIMMFGNFNQHNTFNNCTAKGNTVAQFGQGKDAFGNYGDDFTSINGGDYCCSSRSGSAIIWIRSDHFSMTNATVNNDTGLASQGLVVFGTQATVKSNIFKGFEAGKDVQIRESFSP